MTLGNDLDADLRVVVSDAPLYVAGIQCYECQTANVARITALLVVMGCEILNRSVWSTGRSEPHAFGECL